MRDIILIIWGKVTRLSSFMICTPPSSGGSTRGSERLGELCYRRVWVICIINFPLKTTSQGVNLLINVSYLYKCLIISRYKIIKEKLKAH